MRLRKRFVVFIATVQSLLFLTHFFLYMTWTFGRPQSQANAWLEAAVGLLSVSFVVASILAFSYTNPLVRSFYRIAAVWVGLLSFLVLAAVLAWAGYGIAAVAGLHWDFH